MKLAHRGKGKIMQNKLLKLGMAFIIGSLLTACSSNAIVQDEKKPVASNQTKKQIIKPKKITKRLVKKSQTVARKPNVILPKTAKIRKKYSGHKRSNRRYIAKNNANYTVRKNSAAIKNDAIRRSSHEKYFAIKKESHRKYFANQQQAKQRATAYKRYTPRKKPTYRKYTARKKPVYRKYTARKKPAYRKYTARKKSNYRKPSVRRITPNFSSASFARSLSNAAVGRTRSRVRYDGRYVNIGYPWGDVPSNIGVCTDVVIRSYRRLGIDLQKAVHEDMSNGGFYDYPNVKKWNLRAPDKNIDHRRVYNLQAFFRRHGAQLPITHNPNHYKPGDLVTWMVGPNLPHIGVVVEQRSKADPRRHMIVHNIAHGPQMEDVLFRFRITGHYRYNKNNRLIAPRRFTNVAVNTIQKDYKRIMRELSATPARKPRRNRVKSQPRRGDVNVAQLKAESGISDADINALLGR